MQEQAPVHQGDLEQARRYMQGGLGQSDDFRTREFRLGGPTGPRLLLFYFDGMIDEQAIDERVIKPLMQQGQVAAGSVQDAALIIEESVSSRANVKRTRSYDSAIEAMLDADALVFIENCADFLIIDVTGFPSRSVDKPETEHSVRGSREGFNELIVTNWCLIRRRVKHDNLRIKLLRVGRRSRTRVAVCFIEGVANPAVVQEVRRRVEAIPVDGLQGTQMLEEFLTDHPFSPFPLIRSTERPDEAARQLLGGKVVILVDNVPFCLAVPSTLMDFYQTMDDYNFSPWGSSMVRVMRFLGWLLAIFLPSVYIAVIAVNPEMMPGELAITIAGAREGLPFPPIVEVVIIEILIELIREAALRLPQPLGTTIGVVGGIVVGEAIVQAGLISPLMIIFAATNMLASFTTPTLDIGFTWRILKWVLIALANAFGLVGVVVGWVAILGHMAALSSFGVPYLSPISPLRLPDLGDTIVRLPFWKLKTRPMTLRTLNIDRQGIYEHENQFPNLPGAQERYREGREE
ncbi:MAG: spore germination protein [Bacillota bacterium]